MHSHEKTILTEFISLYKNHSCLWDTTDIAYHNKEARTHAYNILLEKYKELDDEATISVLRKKIDNMRASYKREYRKVLAARAKGGEHRPMLWYYKLLSFIYHTDTDTNAKSDDDSDKSYAGDDFADTHSELLMQLQKNEEPPPNKKQKNSKIYMKENSPNEESVIYSEVDETSSCHDLEEAEAFGRTVGLQLKKLDHFQRIVAEKLISDVIFSARMNKLSAESTLNL